MTAETFHFLRPEWLLALFPAAVLIALAFRAKGRESGSEWSGLVDAHLLRHLTVEGAVGRASRWLAVAFAAGLVAAVLAMAGPTWRKLPTPTYHGGEPSVVVLSLAQSMNGGDLVPSRLGRAGHKLRDILGRAKGEDIGLVIYSDRPFVASPLTDDGAVIAQMLPELSTSLMPVLGNRLDLAIDEAHGLLTRAGAVAGRIVVLADDPGSDGEASLKAATNAERDGFVVNVLGVGTEAGSTLQTAQGQAIRTQEGQDVNMRLDASALAKLAASGGGTFAVISADDGDLDAVFPDQSGAAETAREQTDQTSDAWLDAGYLLLILPILLAPLAFRRGLLAVLVLGVMLVGAGLPGQARAGAWDDLWRTPDQQALAAFKDGDFAAAAQGFTTPDWQAAARYRAGDYAAAATLFGSEDYNRGNALARSGKFEDALAAYDARLKTMPDDADAQYNRDIVAKLLEEQKKKLQQSADQDQQQSDGQGKPQQDQEQGGGQDQQQQGQGAADNQPSGDKGQDGKAQDQESGGQQSAGQDQDQASAQPQDPTASDAQSQGDAANSGQDRAQASSQSNADADQGGDVQDRAQSQDASNGNDQQDQTGKQQAGEDKTDPQSTVGSQESNSEFSQMMDRILGGEAAPSDADAGDQAAVNGAPVLDQAAEQQLRAVPDDPSGLLRARIRQHYSRLRAANQ